jgi:hypothetical protein
MALPKLRGWLADGWGSFPHSFPKQDCKGSLPRCYDDRPGAWESDFSVGQREHDDVRAGHSGQSYAFDCLPASHSFRHSPSCSVHARSRVARLTLLMTLDC